jgi:hypothetical protein
VDIIAKNEVLKTNRPGSESQVKFPFGYVLHMTIAALSKENKTFVRIFRSLPQKQDFLVNTFYFQPVFIIGMQLKPNK